MSIDIGYVATKALSITEMNWDAYYLTNISNIKDQRAVGVSLIRGDGLPTAIVANSSHQLKVFSQVEENCLAHQSFVPAVMSVSL